MMINLLEYEDYSPDHTPFLHGVLPWAQRDFLCYDIWDYSQMFEYQDDRGIEQGDDGKY